MRSSLTPADSTPCWCEGMSGTMSPFACWPKPGIGSGLVTTDYVLDETATLLLARGRGHLAEPLFESIAASKACQMEWVDPDRFHASRQMFLKHLDQGWSFTDCVSFHVMRQRRHGVLDEGDEAAHRQRQPLRLRREP